MTAGYKIDHDWKKPIRFEKPPLALNQSLSHGPFDVLFGIVKTPQHCVLAGVSRRKGTDFPFEPVSAAFIYQTLKSRVETREFFDLPESDEEHDEILRSLAA